MTFFDFVSDYFTSQPVLAVLVGLLFLLAVSVIALEIERASPAKRLRALFASFALAVCVWGFLGLSLVFCDALTGLYSAGEDVLAIRTALGLSVLGASLLALPMAAIVTYKVPGLISRRLESELGEPGGDVKEMASSLSALLGIPTPRVLELQTDLPEAFSVGGSESVVVFSRGMTSTLEPDERETVLAHELAHVKNHDTWVGTVVSVYRRILFFDPFTWLLEGAIASEKEFSADELAARTTGKPLSLASALLKIGSVERPARAVGGFGGLSILGSRRFPRSPTIRERVQRLIKMADDSGSTRG